MLPAAVAVVVIVIVAAAEGLHRINVVLQHVGHKHEKLLPHMLHCVMCVCVCVVCAINCIDSKITSRLTHTWSETI